MQPQKCLTFGVHINYEKNAVLAATKKVYDVIRCSEQLSNAVLASVEADIKTHFDLLKKAIADGKMDVATSESEEVLALFLKETIRVKD